MSFRFISGVLASLLLAMACLCWSASRAAAQDEKTESRLQAVLQVNGKFLPEKGGFKIAETPTEGPGANLVVPDAEDTMRGILEAGDIITEVEGKTFRDRREYLDLFNEAYRKNNGKVRIRIKDGTTGSSVVWIASPVVVRMDVPVANRAFDFLAELGKPVPEAPPVPTVPATIDP